MVVPYKMVNAFQIHQLEDQIASIMIHSRIHAVAAKMDIYIVLIAPFVWKETKTAYNF